jgi:polygalacturonase
MIGIQIVLLLFKLSLTASDQAYLITDFGAVGDGITLNTKAIQEAIDACSGDGGGRVVIPQGEFLSGTLVMKDHVELHVKAGGTLLGSTDITHYPEMQTPYRFYGDQWVKQSLIFGANLTNIGLSGEGIIDGQGAAFQVTTKLKPDRYRNRPYLIRFTQCSGVKVSGLTLRNSAMWMQHYLACDSVLIEGITVYNHCNKNNDMIDIDGCSNVIIKNCVGDTDDDALTLKSTSPRPCENISISDCVLSSHCNAIKLGTESTGGFINVSIRDCVVQPSQEKEVIYGRPEGISGISLEIVDGGIMDGIDISDVIIDGPEVPFFIRLGNRARPYMEGVSKPAPGSLRNIRIHDVIVKSGGKTACSVTGLPGYPVKNISFSDIRMELTGGVKTSDLAEEVPEHEELYPEATMFGLLPASVFYLRHAENIHMDGIEVSFRLADERYPLVVDDVQGLTYSSISVNGNEINSVLEMNNSEK